MLSEREFIPGDFFGQFGFGVGEVVSLDATVGMISGHRSVPAFQKELASSVFFPAEGGSPIAVVIVVQSLISCPSPLVVVA